MDYSVVTHHGEIHFFSVFSSKPATIKLDKLYKRLGICDIEGECWQGDNPKISVSVGIVPKPETGIVSVMEKPE